MTNKIANKNDSVSNKSKIIFGIILVAEAITSFLLLNVLAKLNLLQIWQFLLVAVLFGGIFLFNLYKLILSKHTRYAIRTVCIILAILLTITGAFGYKYARQTIDFVESVTGAHYETQTYQVRVLKTSSYKEINQLARQHVGFLNTNPNLKNTKRALKTPVDYKDKDYLLTL